MTAARDPRGVVAKVADVLGAFTGDHPQLTLADITRRTGLPHATARRTVQQMTGTGLLERRDDGRFVIGTRMWQIGSLAPLTVPLRTVAMPFMSLLHEALRQHVQLAIRDGDHAVVVERLSSFGAVGIVSQVGGHLPLHTSAVGKVLLAHAGQDLIDRVLGAPLPRLTPHSVTDPGRLARELADVRANGYATVREETSMGAASVAAPITAAAGVTGRPSGVMAAISVVVDIGAVNVQSLVPAVVSAARGISSALHRG